VGKKVLLLEHFSKGTTATFVRYLGDYFEYPILLEHCYFIIGLQLIAACELVWPQQI
jgi:hypothetical protein